MTIVNKYDVDIDSRVVKRLSLGEGRLASKETDVGSIPLRLFSFFKKLLLRTLRGDFAPHKK